MIVVAVDYLVDFVAVVVVFVVEVVGLVDGLIAVVAYVRLFLESFGLVYFVVVCVDFVVVV